MDDTNLVSCVKFFHAANLKFCHSVVHHHRLSVGCWAVSAVIPNLFPYRGPLLIH